MRLHLLKTTLLAVPGAGLLTLAPAAFAHEDYDNPHARMHEYLGEEHEAAHESLEAQHEAAHQYPMTARQHRALHRALNQEHRAEHRDLRRQHEEYHDQDYDDPDYYGYYDRGYDRDWRWDDWR
jgi:Spy/CpxP family protein refolding chaperone